MTVGVLALQGAFIEHVKRFRELGADCIELRQSSDLEQHYDALVLPGGESTVQGKLLRELGMFDTIKQQIENGMPVLATCAGLILLAEKIEEQNDCYLGTMPITVKRNAYGRQLGSFYTTEKIEHVGTVPMTFIRAPYVCDVEDGVEVLGKVNGRIIGVQYGKQIGLSFHPELDEDMQIHKYFLTLI